MKIPGCLLPQEECSSIFSITSWLQTFDFILMLDLKLIRSQSETIAENCKNRNLDLDIPELLRLDEEVRAMNTQLDNIRQQRN